jgi:putative hydrolase of the HAD superfamily
MRAGPTAGAALRAVIFDRDGVLTHFDFAPVHALFATEPSASFRAMWDRWSGWYPHQSPPRSAIEEREMLGRFWDLFCDERALSPAFRQALHGFDYTRTIRAFDDARPALERARARGLRVGVLSNFPLASLEESLRATGLASLVDVAAPASVIGASKPDARAYQYVLDRLGVSAAECAMVDDEAPCVQGAISLGISAWRLDRTAPAPAPAGVVRDLAEFTRAWSARLDPPAALRR